MYTYNEILHTLPYSANVITYNTFTKLQDDHTPWLLKKAANTFKTSNIKASTSRQTVKKQDKLYIYIDTHCQTDCQETRQTICRHSLSGSLWIPGPRQSKNTCLMASEADMRVPGLYWTRRKKKMTLIFPANVSTMKQKKIFIVQSWFYKFNKPVHLPFGL